VPWAVLKFWTSLGLPLPVGVGDGIKAKDGDETATESSPTLEQRGFCQNEKARSLQKLCGWPKAHFPRSLAYSVSVLAGYAPSVDLDSSLYGIKTWDDKCAFLGQSELGGILFPKRP
jgi:hypothetical protein